MKDQKKRAYQDVKFELAEIRRLLYKGIRVLDDLDSAQSPAPKPKTKNVRFKDLEKELNDDYSGAVGARLMQWLTKNGYHRQMFKFAAEIGLSQGSLSDLINGKSCPAAATLARFHAYAGIDIVWLLTGWGDHNQ